MWADPGTPLAYAPTSVHNTAPSLRRSPQLRQANSSPYLAGGWVGGNSCPEGAGVPSVRTPSSFLPCACVVNIQRVVFAQDLLCTRHLTDTFSFYLQNSVIWGLLSLVYRQGNWGLERFSDLLTVTKLVNCRAEIHTRSHPYPKAMLSPMQGSPVTWDTRPTGEKFRTLWTATGIEEKQVWEQKHALF